MQRISDMFILSDRNLITPRGLDGPTVFSQPILGASANTDLPPLGTPGRVIIGIIAGFLVFFTLLLLLVFGQRKVKRDGAGDNDAGDIVSTPVAPDPIPTPILPSSSSSSRNASILTIESLACDLPRRLSQSSRNAYEEEIEWPREEVLSQKNYIRCMHEQMELMNTGSPPPSYRSARRSDISNPFIQHSSLSSLPPLPGPSRQIR
ncbi:uncharacterized protein EV420DRAFT_255495 [Desarmillaria tabescens]|uniref:Uncharacterized protein n=1 Tax=Armillaria tabescens TaxID=1929756 RepID=A0AA39KHL0_ARMTA|nr:uncharacterized protein EV420DRAFT_255495 [Desarmillaria tabescens]KAK0460215.1 hypothetical protein EV420DRAFT_255495 [Desarmillaria tabescens]